MRYIIWVDNSSEGWIPEFYENDEQLEEALKKPHYGNMILTKEIKIIVKEEK